MVLASSGKFIVFCREIATMEVNPLSIILVKSDSKGDRLLFRYPYNNPAQFQTNETRKRKTPYSIQNNEDILQTNMSQSSNIAYGNLIFISILFYFRLLFDQFVIFFSRSIVWHIR